MSACAFCKIVDGEAPATIIGRWSGSFGGALALVPLCPITPGHTLFLPQRHVADAAEDPWVTAMVMHHAATFAAERYAAHNILTSTGEAATQSVRHLHVHVVPRAVDDGLMLPWGTLHGEDPKAPHRCRRVVELESALRTT